VSKTLIIGNGEAPDVEALRGWAAAADRVIAADGGCAAALDAGVRLDAVIGDLDSLPNPIRSQVETAGIELVPYPQEKDWTDLELAVERAIDEGATSITLAGVLRGTRTDHGLSAVFLLERILDAGARARIVRARESIELIDDRWDGPAPAGTLVSLLPLSPQVDGVTTQGLAYPLAEETLARVATRGLSNRVIAQPVSVVLRQGRLLVVCRLHDAA
jgi:thiamine pyrophosphokinase